MGDELNYWLIMAIVVVAALGAIVVTHYFPVEGYHQSEASE